MILELCADNMPREIKVGKTEYDLLSMVYEEYEDDVGVFVCLLINTKTNELKKVTF